MWQRFSEFEIMQLQEYDRQRREMVWRLSKHHPSLYFSPKILIHGSALDEIEILYTEEQQKAIDNWEELVKASINFIKKPDFIDKAPPDNGEA